LLSLLRNKKSNLSNEESRSIIIISTNVADFLFAGHQHGLAVGGQYDTAKTTFI
jgi:hypothetical protein